MLVTPITFHFVPRTLGPFDPGPLGSNRISISTPPTLPQEVPMRLMPRKPRPVTHRLGYVFPDLKRPMRYFQRSLQVEGFYLQPDVAVVVDYLCRRHTAKLNIAHAFLGDLNLEIIQPISGQSTFSDFLLRQPAGGLH